MNQELLKEFEELTNDDEISNKFARLEEAEKWLRENSDQHLFSNTTYPESEFELDKDKVLSFILKVADERYKEGFSEGFIEGKKEAKQDFKNKLTHETRKFTDGFSHQKDCPECAKNT